MVQEVVKNNIEIPKWTWTSKVIKQKSKELLEWFEFFEQVENLEKQLVLEKADEKEAWLVWYFVLINWKKVAYFSYKKVNWKIELVNFTTSNAKKDLDLVEKESGKLYEIIQKLDNIKIPFLWQASFLRFIYLIKQKWLKEINFYSSYYSISKWFYKIY